jgi:4-hydroxyproline epimerase
MKHIQFIDSHTGGEPTRLVLAGLPELRAQTMIAARAELQQHHDHYRKALASEPRASDIMVGAYLLPPEHANSLAGVVFFNNVGYLGMCGHGMIGVIATLAYLGRIAPRVHRIDTPAGTVECTLHDDLRVTVRNVPAHRHARDVTVEVPGYGRVTGDIAWGGNWFFLVHGYHSDNCAIDVQHLEALTAFSWAVRVALEAAGICGADGALIDHIELFAKSPHAGVDSRNFVLCPGKAYDRSPCGTGTSAKLACLAADGKLAPDEIWVQESVIGSRFEASYQIRDGRIVPAITGRAYVCAEGKLVLNPDDPFCWGIDA